MENDIFNQLFGNRTPEEWAEIDKKNKEFALRLIEENPQLIMSFGKFAKGDFEEGHRNLYIVWRGKQALYVGISRSDIWGRWFGRGGQSHMYFAQKYSGTLEGGSWIGLSPIGRVIAKNYPKSFKWKIELRYITGWQGWELKDAEEKLIHELRPLFNTAGRAMLTDREHRLANLLRFGKAVPIANEGLILED